MVYSITDDVQYNHTLGFSTINPSKYRLQSPPIKISLI